MRSRASLIRSPLVLLVLASAPAAAGDFTNVAKSVEADIGSNKDGGVTSADFNNDGWPDLLVNKNATDSRLLFWDTSKEEYDDVTKAKANGLTKTKTERAVDRFPQCFSG